MPIISRVEARGWRGRALHAAIIGILSIGAVTMIYPFALMISGAISSEMDESELALVPRYLYRDDVLYRKFLENKYNQDVTDLNKAHLSADFSFRDARVPDQVVARRVLDFRRFAEQADLPQHWQALGAVHGIRTVPENLRRLQNRLTRRFNGDLDALSRESGAPVTGWNTIRLPPVQWLSQRFDYQPGPFYETYFDLLKESDLAERRFVSLTGEYVETMIAPVYGRSSVAAYNASHAQAIKGFADIVLLRTVPGKEQKLNREEWITFVRTELNPSFVRLDHVPAETYQQHLSRQYQSIEALNRSWNRTFRSFSEIDLPARRWLRGAERVNYQQFLLGQPPESYRLEGPEFAWRDWLTKTYGSVEALNRAYGTRYVAFDQARLPLDELEYDFATRRAAALRWKYATHNFVIVFRELITQGNVLKNTAIVCALSILFALLVNPWAAYAMSRFALPGTYKILLFLMVTMSFPPMVTLIPMFILLRELNWLNTFAALVVPFIANGYLIFLLKGFFDSLPRELYEAATIDGSSELRMFFQITMPLSKPILAVVALGAFNSAYTMFLYALIVCPSQKMWLMSVWLFQFQDNSSTSGMFAAVLVACIPTLAIFVLAQNVIMRGIVVPTEKG